MRDSLKQGAEGGSFRGRGLVLNASFSEKQKALTSKASCLG